MIPIISIIGKSDSGKTTLIEKLLAELVKRGYQVGTIKHDVHGFEIDHPGKDSYRHKQAGAVSVVISSPQKVAMVKTVSRELTLDEIASRYFFNLDLILTEGYKGEHKPKIEILTSGDRELLSAKEEILFVVSEKNPHLSLPYLNLKNVKGMADRIQERFLSASSAAKISLLVNGKAIPLNAIMQSMIAKTILGMISALKGTENPRSVDIYIKCHSDRRRREESPRREILRD